MKKVIITILLSGVVLLTACGGSSNNTDSSINTNIEDGNKVPAETTEFSILEVVDVRQSIHVADSAVMWERITVILEGANEQRIFVDRYDIVSVTPDNYTLSMKTLVPGDYVRYYGGYKFERLTSAEINEILDNHTKAEEIK